MAEVKSGLEGVVVAQSKMSKVLGDVGRLIYSGYDIHDLAEYASFEEVAYMLWNCCLPTREQLADFEGDMIGRRGISFQVMGLVRSTPEAGA